ncbi:MAG: FKBP-type peptidyl-prolyl cis-trans isomerase [Fibrobacter sp.]|nr:FKBP-type peptidyl-prolyl cis-trans isomerase [Fibrobacter sp.]
METVEKNKKVSIGYSLKDENGAIIEEVPESFPFVYMHGCDSVIEGLENALEGHHVGDHIVAHVPYDKGYGPYRKDLIIKVSKEELRNIGELWLGMELEMVRDSDMTEFSIPEDPRDIYNKSDDEEDPTIYTIKEIQKETVTLDGNHPFAGKDLTFEVTIVDITEPTVTELETGLPDEYSEEEGDEDGGFDEDFPEDEQNNFGRHWR